MLNPSIELGSGTAAAPESGVIVPLKLTQANELELKDKP
jgi:hypothetical protein